MQVKEPLFLGVRILNDRTADKKPIGVSVRVNLRCDDVIYVSNIKSRMEVIGYEDHNTGLFVTSVDGVDMSSIYHEFRLQAVRFAKQEIDTYLTGLRAMDGESYHNAGYKNIDTLTTALYQCLQDRQDLYADLQKQINLVASRKLPRVNEYLVFRDCASIAYPVTARLPYDNPAKASLSAKERTRVDDFLNVFFDEFNKKAFAWYMGAALCNVNIHDDRVSKLAIVSSSQGGSGKSSIINGLLDGLFTPHFREIKDEFDSFFFNNNKFGVSSLSWKRMSVYSEAKFNNDPTSEKHDFTGMNVSVIKSLITEGYVSSEAKYGDRAMDRLNGFHMVLTNHPPIISEENEALNRRILPLMVKPSKMTSKARELGLWGKNNFDTYIKEHAQSFATYFAQVFLNDEYMFADVDYDHNDYTLDIDDSQSDLDEVKRESRKEVERAKAEGFIRVVETLGAQEHVDVSLLISDVLSIMHGEELEALQNNIRYEDETLYIDGSKAFLLRYGTYAIELRKQLKELYGAPIKRFHKRMFIIPMKQASA